MSNKWLYRILTVLIGGLGAVSVGVAQSPAPCTTPFAEGTVPTGSLYPKVAAPYSATVVTTSDKTLADGTVVHGLVTTYQARDSDGREWRKGSAGCQPGSDGVRRPVIRTWINDPKTGTAMSWQEGDPAKIIRVFHSRPRLPAPPEPTDEHKEAEARQAFEEMGIHMEDLGSKEIDGVMAEGLGTRQTVPVQAGIDKPIQIVGEMWIAKDIDLEVLNTDDNSKTGRKEIRVTELKRGEPDPALFVPPADYTTVDTKPAR